MPAMPNVVGMNLQEAVQALEAATVLNTNYLGYFGQWPITVEWEPEAGPRGIIASQTPAANAEIAVNGAISVTVANYPVSIIYP